MKYHIQISPLSLSLWLGILCLQGCSSMFDCPDTTIEPTAIHTNKMKLIFPGSSFATIIIQGQIFSKRTISIGVVNAEQPNVNLLPSFSSNDLALYINDLPIKYIPRLPLNAGGIHTGSCDSWYYPQFVGYSDELFSDSLQVSIKKTGLDIVSFKVRSPVDTSVLPIIHDSIISDTILFLSIHRRTDSGVYRYSFQDDRGHVILIGDSVTARDVTFAIPFGRISYLNSSAYKRDPASLNIYVAADAELYTDLPPTDSLRIQSFSSTVPISDSITARLRRSLN